MSWWYHPVCALWSVKGLLVAVCGWCGTVVAAPNAERPQGLSFSSPAFDDLTGWERESLPIGNGYFGVSVFGGVTNERLQVSCNEVVSTWDKDGRYNTTDAFEIRLKTDHLGVSNYMRTLNFETGVARVSYDWQGVSYVRECFASYTDRVLVVRFAASRGGALDFDLVGEAPFLKPFGDRSTNGVNGRVVEWSGEGHRLLALQRLEKLDILFASVVDVRTDGVCRRVDKDRMSISGATSAMLICSFASNYRLVPESFRAYPQNMQKLIDPRPVADSFVSVAGERGYVELRRRHEMDLSGLMRRVRLDLPDSQLVRLFQFGRYLLASSSRPGTLPANLQGVWCAYRESPWGDGYWHNINVQMNYWPAFSCNLAECFEAYAAFNAAFRPEAGKFARRFVERYAPENLPPEEPRDWWCVGTGVWPYAVCGPGDHSGPGTGGLTTKLFVDWWDFIQDRAVLQKHIYPALHGMADFFSRCVAETNGLFLSRFSASPEQMVGKLEDTIRWGKDKPVYYTTVGCAFDQQMIHETMADFLRLSDLLGTNDAVVAVARRQIGKYDPVLIGMSGQVKEFREESEYGEIGQHAHRHVSQLVGLYPGSLITSERPDWMAAARYSLIRRGDESTGWALAHRVLCWARLGDGDHAHKLLRCLLEKHTYPNLWDIHPPFQIDGNFGATAGIAEMLIQSHTGHIDLLPALPMAWSKRGSFRGLCARGGFEVDCDWSDGVPVRVIVRSKRGSTPDVRFRGRSCRCVVFVDPH